MVLSPRHRPTWRRAIVVLLLPAFAVALASGCGRADVATQRAPQELFTYPVPVEGVSVQHVVGDAERILGRKITCSEAALAQTKPVRIVGLPRAPRAEVLPLFQALFLTLPLRLFEPDDMKPGLFLETLDSSGSAIRGGGFYWIDDVASQTVQHPIKAVILLRHARAQDLRNAMMAFHDPRNAWFNELTDPNGWLVEAPTATILRMLEAVRALDVPPADSMPTSRIPR
jgi:hypothetical protein